MALSCEPKTEKGEKSSEKSKTGMDACDAQ